MDKIKAFLQKGYFPIQLPPGFTSVTYSENHKKYGPAWIANKAPSCRLEKFSVARSSYNRRSTSIVNPVAYYFLVKEIVQYWGKIQNHFNKSKLSLSRPKLNPSLRAIEISKFSDLYEAKVTKSAGYRYALLTDISRFFPTIYTHTIPWALHGKEVSKKHKEKTPQYYGNIIDQKSMGVQDQQTMGLPIGPDTSHVIAEIIATTIDKALKQKLGYVPSGFRYVDDYCLFFNSRDEAEHVLSELSKIISYYELQINPDKTKIVEVKHLVEESWKYSIKKLEISDEINKQRDDIHNYFESLFSFEKKFKDESLVKYGLKKISTDIIKKPNWDVYEAYLLKCGYSFPNTLQVITTIFATYNKYGYPINKNAIERFCNTLIKSHYIADGHSEMAWALWLAKELEIHLDKESVRCIETSSSSVCKIIALDLSHGRFTATKLLKKNLFPYADKAGLYGDSWLLSYEGGRRGWLYNKSSKYISDDPFFSELLRLGVEFYDTSRRCNPVFDIKEDKVKRNDAGEVDFEYLFDSDFDVDEYFEFEEEDDEYFDSSEEFDEEEDDDEWKVEEWDDDIPL